MKMVRITIGLLLAIVGAEAQERQGIVLDALTLRPIGNVRVILRSQSGITLHTTAADGRFPISDSSGAPVKLLKDGYVQVREEGLLDYSLSRMENPFRMHRVISISGIVVDESSKPVEGASVRMQPKVRLAADLHNQNRMQQTLTDGKFQFSLIPAEYWIEVLDPRYSQDELPGGKRRLPCLLEVDLRDGKEVTGLRISTAPVGVGALRISYRADAGLSTGGRASVVGSLSPAEELYDGAGSPLRFHGEQHRSFAISARDSGTERLASILPGDYWLTATWMLGGDCDICPQTDRISSRRRVRVKAGEEHIEHFVFEKPAPFRIRANWDAVTDTDQVRLEIGSLSFDLQRGLAVVDVNRMLSGEAMKVNVTSRAAPLVVTGLRWNGQSVKNGELRMAAADAVRELEVVLAPRTIPELRSDRAQYSPTVLVREQTREIVRGWQYEPGEYRAFEFFPPLLSYENASSILDKYWEQGRQVTLAAGKSTLVQVPVIRRIP